MSYLRWNSLPKDQGPIDETSALGALTIRAPAPRALRIGVVALALVLELPLAGLVIVHLRPEWLSGLEYRPPTAQVTGPGQRVVAPPITSTTTTSSPGATPVVQTIEPAEGAPGQPVTIMGSGFFSASGEVVATFDRRVVPTRCPTEERCIATVPAARAQQTAVVAIHTPGSTSNAVTFTYATSQASVS